jgi:mannose/fructose/N-acetylgalactosamine-specific phosphotransferase system component IID
LGAATSGVSFFRSVGSVIGVTVFGAIYANSLVANLAGSAGAGPVQAYADALHNVFVGVLPVAALAFLLSWFLEEVPLRSTRVELDPDSGDSSDEQLRAA